MTRSALVGTVVANVSTQLHILNHNNTESNRINVLDKQVFSISNTYLLKYMNATMPVPPFRIISSKSYMHSVILT